MNNNIDDTLNREENENHKRLAELHDVLQHEESRLEDTQDDFEKDAAEGLKQIQHDSIPVLVNELNRNLTTNLKNKRKLKKQIPDQSGVLIAVIVILILAVVAFVVIKKYYQ